MTLPQKLQIIYIVITTMIAGINIAKGKVSDQQKYLSAFSIVTCIGMAGYYYEFTASAFSDVFYAVILEYFYFCFAPVYLLHFFLLYSESKLYSRLIDIFTVYEIFIFMLVIHSNIFPGTFFKSMQLIKVRGTSYITFDHSIVYDINNAVNIIWSVWLIFITYSDYRRHRKEHRLEFLFIFIGSVIPCLGYICDMSGMCGHYYTSIILNVATEIIFEYVVFHYNMFDPVEQAKEDYIHDMDEGVIVTNSDNEAIFHNPAIEKIFTDVDWTDTIEISSDVIGYLERNHSGFSSDGKYYNWRCSDLMNNDHCEGFIYTLIDVTEDYEYTKQLMTLKDEALRAGQVKNIFIANISHEIKTPINSILGMNEMISRKDIPTDIRRYSDNIRSAGYTLLSLINDIMDLSKLEAGRLRIQKNNYDPDAIIYESVGMVQGLIFSRHIGFRVTVSPDMPTTLFGDDIRIRQCLVNILKYSIECTEKGHVELNARCSTGIDADSTELIFTITDTGIGIKANMIPHIFDSILVMSGSGMKTADGHMSVGLSMTKRIADMMGAVIDVESVYGQGSRFTITIPQKVFDGTSIGSYSEHVRKIRGKNSHTGCAFTAPGAHILVIDDADINLTVAKGLMRPFGMQIDVGDSGHKCLEMLNEKHYDMLLIDHMMPEMDGVETVKKIREKEKNSGMPKIRIIAMTGNSLPDARSFYTGHGFDGYITKPLEPSKIQEMLFINLPQGLIVKATDGGDRR